MGNKPKFCPEPKSKAILSDHYVLHLTKVKIPICKLNTALPEFQTIPKRFAFLEGHFLNYYKSLAFSVISLDCKMKARNLERHRYVGYVFYFNFQKINFQINCLSEKLQPVNWEGGHGMEFKNSEVWKSQIIKSIFIKVDRASKWAR